MTKIHFTDVVAQLGRSAQGALADKELGDEMLKTIRSGAKDTNVVAVKDPGHLGKARVFTAEDVVQLREERERLDREKVTKAKMHQEKAAAKIVSSGEGSKSSKHVEKKIISTKKAPVIVLSDWEDEEEDMVGGVGWDEEENGGGGGLCCIYWWYAGPRGCYGVWKRERRG